MLAAVSGRARASAEITGVIALVWFFKGQWGVRVGQIFRAPCNVHAAFSARVIRSM